MHTPQRKTNPATIESDQDSETEVFLSPRGKTDPETPYKPFMTGSEKTITSTPQRLPDSPFPRSLSPKPYKNPGTPYRKVDPPHRDPSSDPLAQTSPPASEIRRDSFKSTESESEGEKTPTAEPKESPRHKPAPVLAPFGPESGAKAKAPEKWPVKPDPSRVKGPSAKPRSTPSPTGSPRGTPTGTPPKTPPKSPPKTPPPPPTIPTAPPTDPAAMGTVDEIKEALIESNRVANMPIPQFYGKKGEKPEDHIMKVEDYFQNYKITDQKKMCDRFRDTCCGKAHTWLSTLTTYPNIFDPEAAPDEEAKAKTMKNIFLACWQLKGRTPQALYMEWQNLKFDPAKDDIEDFCNDVKNLANRLGYPEEAQVMAIKSNIPPVLVTQVINITTFREIRDTLITLVENPVIKRVLMTEGTGEKGLAPFNMSHAQWRPENDAGMDAGMDSGITSVSSSHGAENSRRTPKSLGKLMTKIDDLEFRMRKMTTAENRSRDPPYKPQVAPP